MLGPKIDARLNTLERKLADLTHRLERLEKPQTVDWNAPPEPFQTMIEVPVVTLPVTASVDQFGNIAATAVPSGENIGWRDTAPKRRPPKAKNG